MAYNVDKIVNSLLASLSPRQKEVISRRYGLRSGAPMTLAEIGDSYGVTRERIRQIEAQGLNIIGDQSQNPALESFIKVAASYLRKYDGVRNDQSICAELRKLSEKANVKGGDQKIRFLLEACHQARYYPEDENFRAFWYLTNDDLNSAMAHINKLIASLRSQKGWAPINLVESDPAATNYISLSKNFVTNVYGDFGLSECSEINPRVSRDWAYLVLKKENKPLHFTKLASLINKYRKDRRVNYQTIHNELIKDNRFILVGRGTYGLREFNIVPGTAREVIAHLLKKHGPLPAKDLVKLVLAQRTFKEKTLLLSLRNKKYFQLTTDGKYVIREA